MIIFKDILQTTQILINHAVFVPLKVSETIENKVLL